MTCVYEGWTCPQNNVSLKEWIAAKTLNTYEGTDKPAKMNEQEVPLREWIGLQKTYHEKECIVPQKTYL